MKARSPALCEGCPLCPLRQPNLRKRLPKVTRGTKVIHQQPPKTPKNAERPSVTDLGPPRTAQRSERSAPPRIDPGGGDSGGAVNGSMPGIDQQAPCPGGVRTQVEQVGVSVSKKQHPGPAVGVVNGHSLTSWTSLPWCWITRHGERRVTSPRHDLLGTAIN